MSNLIAFALCLCLVSCAIHEVGRFFLQSFDKAGALLQQNSKFVLTLYYEQEHRGGCGGLVGSW